MRKRSDLGTVDCSYCERTVRKRHPAQLICGKHACRLASKRRYEGVTFNCANCDQEAQKTRSNNRFCSAPACQARSKYGPKLPKKLITCPFCKEQCERRNSRQVTCLSEACSAARKALVRNAARDNKRTGETFKCRFCPVVVERMQENQLTCNSRACEAARKKERTEESRQLALRRKPKICPVCFDPIMEKRFKTHPKCKKPTRVCEICERPGIKSGYRTHPACQRRERNDKRRLKQNLERISREKAAAYANKVPRYSIRGHEPDIALRQYKSASR